MYTGWKIWGLDSIRQLYLYVQWTMVRLLCRSISLHLLPTYVRFYIWGLLEHKDKDIYFSVLQLTSDVTHYQQFLHFTSPEWMLVRLWKLILIFIECWFVTPIIDQMNWIRLDIGNTIRLLCHSALVKCPCVPRWQHSCNDIPIVAGVSSKSILDLAID